MNRVAAVWAFTVAIACLATASPTFGKAHGEGGHSVHGNSGARASGVRSPMPASSHTQPAPRGPIVTRPAPPFHRSFGGFHARHPRGPVFVLIEPPFFESFGYPYYLYYPYSSLYGFGAPLGYAGSPSIIAAPYFCWIDGIGFSDEVQFARHLHDVHGVPLDEALSASELVGGRYVFFGF